MVTNTKDKHLFEFNDMGLVLVAYCNCGFRLGSANKNKVYAVCFDHLDKAQL